MFISGRDVESIPVTGDVEEFVEEEFEEAKADIPAARDEPMAVDICQVQSTE